MTKSGLSASSPLFNSPDDELRRLRARLDAEIATRQGIEQRLTEVQAEIGRAHV